ncbi:unnamed protein product [Callosobruchus maculatus]|uniref:Uncharacterized protein n=1 Tax=Callosobruchus maculatus TaxID=64391 RepID=A0A653BYW4_CALMS|nr:unnamed protein product [Callosobruchus maculatus]
MRILLAGGFLLSFFFVGMGCNNCQKI